MRSFFSLDPFVTCARIKLPLLSRLHIMSGKVGDTDKGSVDVLRKNLLSALPLLAENDIVGLIEPINKYSVPGYFLSDFDTGKRHPLNSV